MSWKPKYVFCQYLVQANSVTISEENVEASLNREKSIHHLYCSIALTRNTAMLTHTYHSHTRIQSCTREVEKNVLRHTVPSDFYTEIQ